MDNITNCDRIKNMSVEEMAHIFALVKLNTVRELFPDFSFDDKIIEKQCANCLKWLNSESDDG